MEFQTFQGDNFRVDIGDTSQLIDDAANPQVILMQAGGDPFHVKTINNQDTKFFGIGGKQVVLQVVSSQSISISTFADGPDKRFQVTAYLNPTGAVEQVFAGYLVTADLQQLFLPNPQTIVLTASDQLGLLKDIPLSDDTGVRIIGKHKLSYFIAQCLKKTGLNLPIRVMNNLRLGGGAVSVQAAFDSTNNSIITTNSNFFYPGQRIAVTGAGANDQTYTVIGAELLGALIVFVNEDVAVTLPLTPVTIQDQGSLTHIYDTLYVDALTYESNINESEDCYTVLTKILTLDSNITEQEGAWFIGRTDEYDNNRMYVAEFDADGNYISIAEDTTLARNVGATEVRRFANADNILSLQRPYGFIQNTYHYNFPQEIVCNVNFDRGDFIRDLDPVTVEDIAYQAKAYTIECWDWASWKVNGDSDSISAEIYTKKLYYNNQERDRYLHLDPTTLTVPGNLRSSPLPVYLGDKIIFSASTRWNDFGHGEAPAFMGILLAADDGSYWALGGMYGEDCWWSRYTTIQESGYVAMISSHPAIDDTTYEDWFTQTVETPAIPRSGTLYFFLSANFISGSTTYQEFSDISIQYLPFINGSYQTYSGQAYSVTRNEPGYSAKQESEVYLSNSPRPAFKGALFFLSGGEFFLATNFYSAAPYALGSPTDLTAVNTYGYHQAFAVWNQVRRTLRAFNGTIYGLGSNWPDMVHKYALTDTNPETNNRYFLLLSYDQNWRTCQMSANLVEVYNFEGKRYDDPWNFKYVSE